LDRTAPREVRSRGLRRLGTLWLCVALLTLVAAVGSGDSAKAASGCQTSDGSGYDVTICFRSPHDDARLTGRERVATSVSVSGSSPGVQLVEFRLGARYLLTDYTAPYKFTFPTQKFMDQSGSLRAVAEMHDGFWTDAAEISVSLHNGNRVRPRNHGSFRPTKGTRPRKGRRFVLAAVGDGADGGPNAAAVTSLIAGWKPNLFLYLGDVYEKGRISEFMNWYAPSRFFGRFHDRTDPAIGNHEYENGLAPGYFDYWDNVPHYYSVNAGHWHLISLDSTSEFDQIDPGTRQYEWLVRDLTRSRSRCTLAYFHHPFLSIGPQGDNPEMSALWSLLAAGGVDVVVTGHDHSYERWEPLGGDGQPARHGITQFVVGSGGHGIQAFVDSDSRFVTGQDESPRAYGALRMKLGRRDARFRFENITHHVLDAGHIRCQPGTRPSFEDRFETGALHRWDRHRGLIVQRHEKHRGRWAVRAATTGRRAFALTRVRPSTQGLAYRVWFRTRRVGTSAYLLKLRTAEGQPLLGIAMTPSRRLVLHDFVTGDAAKSRARFSARRWHSLTVRLDTAGAAVGTKLDGKRLRALSGHWSFEQHRIGRLQLGDNRAGRSFNVAFDDVSAEALLQG
jgi:Calcineurin-like phosphoesterase